MLYNLEDWKNIIHFGNFFGFHLEINILFGFGNNTESRSRCNGEKNRCRIRPKNFKIV